MTLPSVFGCQVCSALEKQNVPKDKVFFGAKCASAQKRRYGKALQHIARGRTTSGARGMRFKPRQTRNGTRCQEITPAHYAETATQGTQEEIAQPTSRNATDATG